jgi:CRP/FNR family transcriptional regulator, anaerobic regulatory protein
MLAVSRSEIDEPLPVAARANRYECRASFDEAPVRALGRGEVLFQAGDTRSRIYRVERGALCHYFRWDDGRHEIIEFAFPGDIVGFGHLENHVSTAQAIAETVVSFVSPEEFEQTAATDGQLASRLAAAADREFDYMRLRAVDSGRGKPVERLASFLTALSHLSADEGRDPTLVTDEISSGFVAEHLDMTLEALARALRELEHRGMVRSTTDGLRIADADALEKLAGAA